MLKTLEIVPQEFGGILSVADGWLPVAQDILQNGTVYCLKHCFDEQPIDAIRQAVFTHYAALPQTHIESWEAGAINYHCIRRGVSQKQKAIHYFHEYAFNNLENIPGDIRTPLALMFQSLAALYNDLTSQKARLNEEEDNCVRLRPAFMHYFSGGGMFGTHSHHLEPQKIGLILSLSKRGRDYLEGGTGFEAPDGSMVDTSLVHDIGDVLLFRYDLKHWVLPCDVTQPLDEQSIAGRWNALLPRY